MKTIFHMITFWVFVVIKAYGTLFAAWSWWWLLLPIVPELYVALGKAGLL